MCSLCPFLFTFGQFFFIIAFFFSLFCFIAVNYLRLNKASTARKTFVSAWNQRCVGIQGIPRTRLCVRLCICVFLCSLLFSFFYLPMCQSRSIFVYKSMRLSESVVINYTFPCVYLFIYLFAFNLKLRIIAIPLSAAKEKINFQKMKFKLNKGKNDFENHLQLLDLSICNWMWFISNMPFTSPGPFAFYSALI